MSELDKIVAGEILAEFMNSEGQTIRYVKTDDGKVYRYNCSNKTYVQLHDRFTPKEYLNENNVLGVFSQKIITSVNYAASDLGIELGRGVDTLATLISGTWVHVQTVPEIGSV